MQMGISKKKLKKQTGSKIGTRGNKLKNVFKY
jgi:hypothetical protein